MSKFVVIFAIFLIVAYAQAAPESNGDCYDEGTKTTVKRGEVAYPKGECLRLICSDDGFLRPEPCELGIAPNCRVVDGDSSKQWPGCCPTVKCD